MNISVVLINSGPEFYLSIK